MNPIIRHDRCDGCNKFLQNHQHVVALIPDVEITTRDLSKGLVRLKLSVDSIDTRTLKVYCNKCLQLSDYLLHEREKNG